MPTDIQLAVARDLAKGYDLMARHFISSGLVINEYRWGELEGVTPDGEIVIDKDVFGNPFPFKENNASKSNPL